MASGSAAGLGGRHAGVRAVAAGVWGLVPRAAAVIVCKLDNAVRGGKLSAAKHGHRAPSMRIQKVSGKGNDGWDSVRGRWGPACGAAGAASGGKRALYLRVFAHLRQHNGALLKNRRAVIASQVIEAGGATHYMSVLTATSPEQGT
jgi:hypothetical protein